MPMKKTPKELGYRMPAEWEKQDAVWISWPHNRETWPEGISEVEESYVQFVKALHASEKVNILVNDETFKLDAIDKLSKFKVNISQIVFHKIKNVDAWIRDYGPTFVINEKAKQKIAMVKWVFNAWGNKYQDLKEDEGIQYEINKFLKVPIFEPGIVLEGGSIEVNGCGTALTTEQCLLNKNRNPNLSKESIERCLKDCLNVSKVIWLKEGIIGDDTDGHIDDIARFVNKNTIVCAYEEDKSDENYNILNENYNLLKSMSDQDGKKLNIIKLPMPGIVKNKETRLPASYTNFYIGNGVVAVPIFGHKNDKNAIEIIQKLFPGRKVVGINCTRMVYGLGTLHCCSQQQPSTEI